MFEFLKKQLEEPEKNLDEAKYKHFRVNEHLEHVTRTEENEQSKYSWIKCKNCFDSFHYDGHIKEDSLEYMACRKCSVNLATGEYDEDYIVINVNDLDDLKRLVNKVIKKGYKPIGKITEGSYSRLYQAMIKKEKE